MKFPFRILSSLGLTIILLGFSMVLILAGTLEQVDLGIHAAQKKYFESLYVWTAIPFSATLFQWAFKTIITVPLPGGFLLSGLLLVNLLAAHVSRFKMSWKKSGIFLTHLGIILMLVGMGLTTLLSRESRMKIHEGGTSNYSESVEDVELAIVNTTHPKSNEVIAIPEKLLRKKQPLNHPQLPFTVEIKEWFSNSALEMRKPEDKDLIHLANQGMGPRIKLQPLPPATRQDEISMFSAFVELTAQGKSLGIWLLSRHLGNPQSLVYDGKTYELSIRPERFYKTFSLTLIDFKHDIYPGTDIPKNFSSRVQLKDPLLKEDREVLIYMNNPLRHGGETYYQASFEDNDTTTVFQVVKNPSWLTPYLSCLLMTVGLCIQFGIHLYEFFQRRHA